MGFYSLGREVKIYGQKNVSYATQFLGKCSEFKIATFYQ